MTTTDAPSTDPPLGYYLGRPVQGATLQITGTGASLDKGLDMAPEALDPGETYDVVLRCRVTEHRHEYDDDFDAYQLVNRAKAEAATIVERGQSASDALDRAEQKIAERKSEAERRKKAEQGQDQLPYDETEEPHGNGDAPAGGEPEAVGDVAGAEFEHTIGIAEQAETSADWRNARTKELDRRTRDDLVEIAGPLGVDADGLTKRELVEEIIDAEEVSRG